MHMQIEIVDYTSRKIYQSGNGFSIHGENGLVLGYVQTDKGEHVVEVERFYNQEAVLTHFTSREDVIKFICTFERELPRLRLIYDKLLSHTEVGVFHAFNPLTSYPFHIGLDADVQHHFGFGDMGSDKSSVSYAEKDAEVTRDLFMKTMNSVLHELIYSKPQGLGYHSLPFLPSMTEAEKLNFLQNYMKHNLEGAISKPQVDLSRPIVQPSDVPYDFSDIKKIIDNATHLKPKCPFGSSDSNVHTVFLTDPHLFDFFGLNGHFSMGVPTETAGKACNLLSGADLLAHLKKIQKGDNPTTKVEEASTPTTTSAPSERVEVPKPRHIQAFEEKVDKAHSERKQKHQNNGKEHRRSGGNRRRKGDHSPKSPYTRPHKNRK